MKSTPFLFVIPTLLLLACSPKQAEEASEQSIYLSPDVMCGTVVLTDGCGPKTDTLVRFGLALIHHMTYEDARYTFEQVMAKDPDCFWGPWGKAMTYIHPLWPDQLTAQEMETGHVLAQKAITLAQNERQKLWGEALASFYVKEDLNKIQRLGKFQAGWAKAVDANPDDVESKLFNGLFRLAVVPPSDKSYTVQTEVGAMAEELLKTYPDHPGAFHYGIHAYDVPPLADKAVFLAQNYGKVAPEIPHALHMPSHIFTRLGYWQESIDWNYRSAKAAERAPMDGHTSSHMYHALDYMTYALLQFGEDERAESILNGLDTLKLPHSVNPATAYALAAIPSRIPLEQGKWNEAAALAEPDTSEFPWKKFPQYEALIHYAKGIGAARSGNAEQANQEMGKIATLQGALDQNNPQSKYWQDQMEIQRLAISAWSAYASGSPDEAISLMQQSADLEYKTQKNPVSPGTLVPAGELLGDLYFEMKKYTEAIAAYEKSLIENPNRFNTLYSIAKAAELKGDLEKAKSYYTQLVALKGKTPSTREQLKHAEKVLAG